MTDAPSTATAQAAPGARPWRPGLRLALFYIVVFWVIGVRLPFWPLFLEERGFSEGEIGVLIGTTSFAIIVVVPVVARIVDWLGRRRPVLAALGIGAVAGHLLFLPRWDFVGMLVVTMLAASLYTALMPMTDNLAVLLNREKQIDYGRVRLWGSISFIIASYGGGAALDLAGTREATLWLMLAGTGGILLLAPTLPDIVVPREERSRSAIRPLLTWRPFALFLAAVGFSHAGHGVLYAFASIHWDAAGIDEATIGALWAVGVVAEIGVFAIGAALSRRIGPAGLIMLGAGAGVVRWAALASTTALPALVAAQALHGLTFGATHLGTMHFIGQAIPPAQSATAQSLNSAATFGLALGVSLQASGFLYGALGGQAFWVMGGFAVVSFALASILAATWRGEELPTVR